MCGSIWETGGRGGWKLPRGYEYNHESQEDPLVPKLGAEPAGEKKSMAGKTAASRVAERYRKAVGRRAFLSNLREHSGSELLGDPSAGCQGFQGKQVGLEDAGVSALPRWVSWQETVNISLFLVTGDREAGYNFPGVGTGLGKSILLRFQERFY